MNVSTLEVIFDYSCPHCYRSYLDLKTIREEFPDLQFAFKPCEAHPRPEDWSPHSDLAVKGMFYCLDHGIDLWEYHELVYNAYHVDHIDTENIDALSAYLADLLDAADFKAVVAGDTYESKRLEGNRYAWETLALPAVPSYCHGDQVLKALPGIGVSRSMLLEFLNA